MSPTACFPSVVIPCSPSMMTKYDIIPYEVKAKMFAKNEKYAMYLRFGT